MPFRDQLEAILGDRNNLRADVVHRLNDFLRCPDNVFAGLLAEVDRVRAERHDEEDWLWAGLVFSFATMQGANIYPCVRDTRNQWAWHNLPAGRDAVEQRMNEVFHTQNADNFRVRYAMAAHDRIMALGGLKDATRMAAKLGSWQEKYDFIVAFDGIGPKYARNFWMDRHDPGFDQSFALDSRIQNLVRMLFVPPAQPWIVDNLGYILVREATYRMMEEFLRELTDSSGRCPWYRDRLLYAAMAPERREAFLNWLDTGTLGDNIPAGGGGVGSCR